MQHKNETIPATVKKTSYRLNVFSFFIKRMFNFLGIFILVVCIYIHHLQHFHIELTLSQGRHTIGSQAIQPDYQQTIQCNCLHKNAFVLDVSYV